MKTKRIHNFLIFACAFLWIMMMGSKNVYTAELDVLQDIFNAPKADISMAMTWYFITYSSLQVLLFFILDKIDIKWYLFITIFLSGIVTVVIAFITNLWGMYWLLALNGLLQAAVWGMCIAVLTKYLPKEKMPFANTVMNIGTAIAGIISYGSASLFVELGKWNVPFIFLGIILSFSGILFFLAVHLCQKLPASEKELAINETNSELDLLPLTSKLKKALFFIVSFLISIFIHSVFYAGMNWMPSLLTEVHKQEPSVGILISVLAPLATILGSIFAIKHCEKYKNFIAVALVYMLITSVFSALLVFLFDANMYVAIICLILFLVISMGEITIVFSVLSLKMGKYVNSGAHSGLMNAAGGYAAGFAPTIAGAIIDNTNWFTLYLVMFIICFVLLLTVLGFYLATKKRAK